MLTSSGLSRKTPISSASSMSDNRVKPFSNSKAILLQSTVSNGPQFVVGPLPLAQTTALSSFGIFSTKITRLPSLKVHQHSHTMVARTHHQRWNAGQQPRGSANSKCQI